MAIDAGLKASTTRTVRSPTFSPALYPGGSSPRLSLRLQNRAIDARYKYVFLFYRSNGAAMESAITSKGQATIPKAVRDHLHLKPGDRVKFFVHPDGTVVLLPKIPVSALRGMLRSRRAPVTIDEMREAAAAAAVGSRRRVRRR